MSEPKIGKWEEGWCPYCGNAAQELADLKISKQQVIRERDKWFNKYKQHESLKQLVEELDGFYPDNPRIADVLMRMRKAIKE